VTCLRPRVPEQIESLDVTAGSDVAFAFGLAEVDDRWIVTHAHHSFADATG
jgi:hypothetical protein